MLASLLRLETLLKCDICDNLLRSTRTLKECGHRYCENCIYDRLGEERQCPKCHMPAIVKNLRQDPMHDTLVACVKKLKLCMMDTEMESLSLPALGPSINSDYNDIHHGSQQLDLEPSQHQEQQSFTNSDTDTCSADDRPNTFALPLPSGQYRQQQHSFDSVATTQSSQHLQPTSLHQRSSSGNRLVVQPAANEPHSTNDLLLAMEGEDVTYDDDDDPKADVKSGGNNTRSLSSSTQHCSNTDDLLAAMESEEWVINAYDDDDDDFLPTQHSNKPPFKKHTPSPLPSSTSTRRRLSSDTNIRYQEPKTKQQKTSPTPGNITFSTPQPPAGNNQRLRWKCSNCRYGGNGADQLNCGICRKERKGDIDMKMNPTLTIPDTLTLPPTSNLSMSTSFCVPSTVTTDTQQQQQQQDQSGDVIHLMSTSLSAEDDAIINTSMTMAIDICLKMEIYSDTRDIDNVTHLITSVNDQGLCTRTIKYLLCIITGKWIVNASWLIESVQAGYWLPEEKYQVIGDKTSGKTHGPERGRQRRLMGNDTGDLFYCDGPVRFYFYGDFPDHDTKVMLLQLVRKGGGKIVTRRDQNQNGLVVIVHSLSALRQSKKKKAHAWLDNCIHLKDSQWLLDTVARSEMVLD
ncbi:hypothetical protein BC941DRAFT_408453 [Chlamydoabsidia padenii]|nr:hypothetical protein BC941DRAFT_408453 [Chlamydoabsidia padenii]